jgi:hypothetical protein
MTLKDTTLPGFVRNRQFYSQPMASGNCIYQAKFSGYQGTNYLNGGLMIAESATQKNLNWAFAFYGADYYDVSWYSTWGGASTGVVLQTNAPPPLSFLNRTCFMYWQIEVSGSNLIFSYSLTGAVDTWVVYATTPTSSWFTAAPDLIGFYVESLNSGVGAETTVDWFRRIA